MTTVNYIIVVKLPHNHMITGSHSSSAFSVKIKRKHEIKYIHNCKCIINLTIYLLDSEYPNINTIRI